VLVPILSTLPPSPHGCRSASPAQRCVTQMKGARSSRSFLALYFIEVEGIKKRKLLPKPEGSAWLGPKSMRMEECEKNCVWFSLPAFQLNVNSISWATHIHHICIRRKEAHSMGKKSDRCTRRTPKNQKAHNYNTRESRQKLPHPAFRPPSLPAFSSLLASACVS